MKKLTAVVTILAAAAVALAQQPSGTRESGRGSSRPDPAEAKAGEATYLRYCAACHGRSLLGDGAVAPGLINVPTNLTTLTVMNGGTFPYDRVAAIIDGSQTSRIHGTPDMPVWGEIFAAGKGTGTSSAEVVVRRITHYIWSRQARSAAPPKK